LDEHLNNIADRELEQDEPENILLLCIVEKREGQKHHDNGYCMQMFNRRKSQQGHNTVFFNLMQPDSLTDSIFCCLDVIPLSFRGITYCSS